MKPNQQTLEVLAAILALSIRHKANLADDGRESVWEMMGYIKERGVIKTALEGIKEVPQELSHLQSEDVPEIASAVSLILNEWGVNHRRQDITTEIIRDIVDSIPVFKEAYHRWQIIANLPSTAIPV